MRKGRRVFGSGCSLAIAALLSLDAPASAQTASASTPPVEREAASPALIVPASPTFSQLFTGTVSDFRHLPSRDTATWLGIGAAVALIGHTQDLQTSRSLSGSDGLGDALDAGRAIGGARAQLGGALATYAVGRLTNSPRTTSVGADLFHAQMLAQGMTFAVKLSIRRTRPDGSQFSFPSGHASVSFASATVLQRHFGWKVGIPAYSVATYVAASRIQEKRHFLSDVAFGAAIGIVAGRTVTVGRGHARFAVVPTVASSGGGGIAFTWLGTRP